LEIDASAMELEANKLADKGENTSRLTLLETAMPHAEVL